MSKVITNRELNLIEMETVAGGSKRDSGGLDAAKKIDLSKLLAQLDHAIATAKHNM